MRRSKEVQVAMEVMMVPLLATIPYKLRGSYTQVRIRSSRQSTSLKRSLPLTPL